MFLVLANHRPEDRLLTPAAAPTAPTPKKKPTRQRPKTPRTISRLVAAIEAAYIAELARA